jgi:hypothetical protein
MFKLIKFIFAIIFITLFLEVNSYVQSSGNRNWFLKDINTPINIQPASKEEKIVIAIVDDGIRITHRDLQKFIWKNTKEIADNKIDDDGNGYVDDVYGWDVADKNNTVMPPQHRLNSFYHGTHLSGIVAKIAQSSYGDIASDSIQIMPVKSLADSATKTYLKDGYKGIQYAIKAGANIIICAWGMGHISPDESKILQEANEKGILIVASAGNFSEEMEQYPAAHESVLAVAALNQEHKKIENSNYGSFVDLSAPGIDILSTSVQSDMDYETREGTSPAAAMVAAAAALVKLQHPNYSVEKVKACLKTSSDAIDQLNQQYSAKLGAGKLNIESAIKCNLFNEETRKENRLNNPQGYLHFFGPKGKSAAWNIKPYGVFKGLWFKLRYMQGNPGQSILSFYSSDSSDAKMLASYPLATFFESVYIPGTTAYVIFEPKGKVQKLDWLLEYRAEAINFSKLYCQDTKYLDVEGTFEDGSGLNNYSQNSDCKWLITAPEGKVIHIKFTEFHTEANTDLLYFFNGSGTHEKIMAIFSGPNIPPELTTWRNQVLVWFVTDGKNQGKGWKAEYIFREP